MEETTVQSKFNNNTRSLSQ